MTDFPTFKKDQHLENGSEPDTDPFDDLSSMNLFEPETNVAHLMGHVCTSIGAETEQNIDEVRSYAEKALGARQDKYHEFARALSGSLADGVLTDVEKMELIDFIDDEMQKEREGRRERAQKKSKELDKENKLQKRCQQFVKQKIVNEIIGLLVTYMAGLRKQQGKSSELQRMLEARGINFHGLDDEFIEKLLKADMVTRKRLIEKLMEKAENRMLMQDLTADQMAEELLRLAESYRRNLLERFIRQVEEDADSAPREVSLDKFVLCAQKPAQSDEGRELELAFSIESLSLNEARRCVAADVVAYIIGTFCVLPDGQPPEVERSVPNSVAEKCLHSNLFYHGHAFNIVPDFRTYLTSLGNRIGGSADISTRISSVLEEKNVSLFDASGKLVEVADLFSLNQNGCDHTLMTTLRNILRDRYFVFGGGFELEALYYPDLVLWERENFSWSLEHMLAVCGARFDPAANDLGAFLFNELRNLPPNLLTDILGEATSSRLRNALERFPEVDAAAQTLEVLYEYGFEKFVAGSGAYAEMAVHPEQTEVELETEYGSELVDFWRRMGVLQFTADSRRLCL